MRWHLSLIQGRIPRLPKTARPLALIIFVAAAAPALQAGTPVPPSAHGNPRFTPAVEAARRVKGAVVNIHSERTVHNAINDPFNPGLTTQNRVNGMGTGIVIDPRGYIITNQHVVEDVQLIRIKLSDGSAQNGRVISRDSEHDLALLKIDVDHPLPTIPLGTAVDLMELEPVIAIGNAYGYENTHTMGTVSAIKRDVALNKEMSYKGLIQTDASINPGNSGGPLLNIHGELIGVNVAIRAGAQNIGFAIPVDQMIQVAADLLSVRRRLGYGHGIVVQDQVDTSSNPVARTAVVQGVEPGSAAEKAGVRAADRIISAGGIAVVCAMDLERGFIEKAPGDTVTLVVRRGAEDKKLEVTLPGMSERVVTASSPAATVDYVWRRFGIKVALADAGMVAKANPQLRGGLYITEVDSDSPAGKAGMQRGDILVGLHQFETLSLENVTWVLNHPELDSFSPLKFFLVRGGQVRRGQLSQLR
jgi:serine protease Do